MGAREPSSFYFSRKRKDESPTASLCLPAPAAVGLGPSATGRLLTAVWRRAAAAPPRPSREEAVLLAHVAHSAELGPGVLHLCLPLRWPGPGSTGQCPALRRPRPSPRPALQYPVPFSARCNGRNGQKMRHSGSKNCHRSVEKCKGKLVVTLYVNIWVPDTNLRRFDVIYVQNWAGKWHLVGF